METSEAISLVRNRLKSANVDAFMTDRQLYSEIMSVCTYLLHTTKGATNTFEDDDCYTFIPYMKLIDVSEKENTCMDIVTRCKIKRTEEKIPEIVKGYSGSLIRFVGTVGRTKKFMKTTAVGFENILNSSNYKYDTDIYYWISDSYIYVARVYLEALSIEAVFKEEPIHLMCRECGEKKKCIDMRKSKFPMSEYLLESAAEIIVGQLDNSMRIQYDGANNNEHPLRQ